MTKPISQVVVRDAGAIRAIAVASSCETHLVAGRYSCEGDVVRTGSRYVRLRSAAGNLYLVAERHLLGTPGSARRVYRGAPTPKEHATAVAAPEVHEMTPEQRREVRLQLWASQPLKRHRLGTYTECGSMDAWDVDYSIERKDGEWIVTKDGPEGEEESVSAAVGDEGKLAEEVWELGYDPADLAR